MFLNYLANGVRAYGLRSLAPYMRRCWAFQFNLRGASTMLLREGNESRKIRLEGALGSFVGPDCEHGWGGKPEDECDVLVFHFDEVASLLQSVVGRDGYRVFPISEEQIVLLEAWYERCRIARGEEGFFAPQIYQIVASELALLVLKTMPKGELGLPPDLAQAKVAAALAWYGARLPSAPTIGEVAEALHLSTAHLRRLFHRATQLSPQAVLTRVQFERAIDLMRNPTLTLEQIAENAGFGSASAFSRAFKGAYGVAPIEYRRGLIPNRLQNKPNSLVLFATGGVAPQL